MVVYQGTTLLDAGFVSNTGAWNLVYSGTSMQVTVTVIGNANTATSWSYTVACPT